MYWIVQELIYTVLIKLLMIVNGHIRLLLQDVVKPRGPLSAAQASCVRTVVHHECHTSGVHVWVQTISSFNDTLIADLTVWVTLHQMPSVKETPGTRNWDCNM